MDFDDSHSVSRTHPSAVIIPTAWAVAQQTSASFSDIVSACVAGYEVLLRLAAVDPATLLARGFYPTAVMGRSRPAWSRAGCWAWTPHR